MDRELIEAFLKSAESDLRLAVDLLKEGKCYYAGVFFSQQSAEKIAKAYLASKGIKNTIRRRDVSGVLGHYISEKEIIKALQFPEAHVTKARYPFRFERRLVSPPEAYTKEENRGCR
jgi:HEPN domain-containing protein